jgi:GDP-4-dehydro-6-deoxy-D-mannose reductase
LTRVLITGATGFVGGHLAEHLAAIGGLEVHGLGRRAPERLPALPLARLHFADLADRERAREVVLEARPELVFHLAGQASIPAAWADPAGTFLANVVGEINLLDALVELAPGARVLVVGSSDEYGLVRPDELPIGESQPFRPTSPYGVSKISQEMLGYQYFLSRGLAVVRVRAFNHFGPRQRDAFVASAFARQVAEAEAGLIEPVLRVGNLAARRDFTDVRDVVRAYWLALTQGEPGEVYNVGSGRAVAIQSLLDTLVEMSRARLRVEPDPARLRPADVPVIYASVAKLAARTGWLPEIPLERTLRDTLEDWRARVRQATR